MPEEASGLDPQFDQRLQALIEASGGRIWINSGYRSVERQQQLFDAAVAKYGSVEAARKWVAPPGKSNHNFGLAADLGGDLALAHQLAPQFGLIFPMSWEDWHIEPVWARQARGADYKDSHPTPPPGESVSDSNYGSLAHQVQVMGSLLRGEPLDMYYDEPQNGSPGAGGESAGGAGAGGGGDRSGLYRDLIAQGLDPVHAAALVAIAGRESSYDPTAHNGNRATGDDSYGLFQINLLGGQHSQWTPDQLSTYEGSVQAGAELVKQSGLQPWGGYKGVSWSQGTDLEAAAAASGGEVTVADLQAIANEGV